MAFLPRKLTLGIFLLMGITCQPMSAECIVPLTSVTQAADDDALSAAKQDALNLLENLTQEGTDPGCYTREDRETFRNAIESATTTAEVANAVKAYKAAVQGVRVSDDENEYWYYIISGPSMAYCQNAAIYDLTAKNGEQLKWNDLAPDAHCMWKFVNGSNGRLRIVNRATGRYIKNPGTLGAKVTSETNKILATSFNLESLGEQRAFLIRESSSKNPVHADQNGVIVAWRTVTIGSASVWHFDPVSQEDLDALNPDNDTWELVWADEFDVDGPVNPENWTFEKGFVRNSEPQWYQENNAICKDGNLIITARKERVRNPKYDAASSDWKLNREYAEYTSSSIITQNKRDLLYGRMEVRAKIPVSSGAWPAIWCKGYPNISGSWPACGEVDILEFYQKSIFANVAWSNATGVSQWRTVKTPFTHFTGMDSQWADKYHVWRMDWDSLSIRLYLDDELLNVTSLERTVQPVGDFCKSANPFKHPMFILLNLALRSPDGIDESYLPMSYYVDYVRFYQKKDDSTGISELPTDREDAWLVNIPGNPYIDVNAFDGTVSIRIYSMSGLQMRSDRVSPGQSLYSLNGLPKGIYIIKATDGKGSRSARIAIN